MSTSVLAIGDVGAGTVLHLGDEAMLQAAVHEIGQRLPVRWTVVSADPQETRSRHGVAAINRIDFARCRTTASREARLAEVLAAARRERSLPAHDPAIGVLDAVAAADVVLVAGGGNLTSSWPEHVYERAALAGVAAELGVPVVVTGQGLGPQLSARDGELVAGLLTGARFVGVRETASAELALQLGVVEERLWCAPDDAAYLADPAADLVLAALDVEEGAFVTATFSAYSGMCATDEWQPQLTGVLDAVVELTQLDVLLVPHVRSTAGGNDDVAFHRLLAEKAKSGRVRPVAMQSAQAAAVLAGSAAMVVSSRYHPVVFAVNNAVPAVGLAVDRYTAQKLRGAMQLMGVEDWTVSALAGPEVWFDAVAECWDRREELGADLRPRVRWRSAEKTRYWDALCEALVGEAPTAPAPPTPAARSNAHGTWVPHNALALRLGGQVSTRVDDLQHQLDQAAGHVAEIAADLQAARAEQAVLRDALSALEVDLSVERAAGDVARSERAAQFESAADTANALERVTAELAEVHRTKVMRWTRTAREVYAVTRRREQA